MTEPERARRAAASARRRQSERQSDAPARVRHEFDNRALANEVLSGRTERFRGTALLRSLEDRKR